MFRELARCWEWKGDGVFVIIDFVFLLFRFLGFIIYSLYRFKRLFLVDEMVSLLFNKEGVFSFVFYVVDGRDWEGLSWFI